MMTSSDNIVIKKEEFNVEDCLPQQQTFHPLQHSLHNLLVDDQDIHDQVATLNSLNISDQQQQQQSLVDNLLLDTGTNSSNSTPTTLFNNNNSLFTDNDNNYLLFRNNSFSIKNNNNNSPFMNYDITQPHQQLLRRESFPNLKSSYEDHLYSNPMYSSNDWQQKNNVFLMQQQYRKFSFDVPPTNRLTPSYSNPDLRRTGSLDANSANNNFDISSTMSPLLVSHLLRQMSINNKQTSPTLRKSSLVPLRRTSSTITNDDRFASIQLDDVIHDVYNLCKDQYGCRYFQKKLEEQVPEQRDMIFIQVYPHFIELMTDPFGNYLCQKLMEYCTDTQRTMMVEQVSTAILSISLNMHGTRAVQRMIEFSTIPEQIEKIIKALSPNVVTLIKDINGNHVIQKCLNKLSFKDKQFIYDSVSANCIEVATHRHGCCVLQRCIDFSADSQKKQLVNEIIRNALTLVQDPYGNYVVQYVLELGDAYFSDQLIRQFIGHIANLSIQKYSSNVMEKCIRVAEEDTRHDLIEEMINKQQLERLLKDSFANYVVQTALDFAEDVQHQKLSECIRPLLPMIRNTTYCKRIQGKLNRNQQQYVYQQSSTYPFNANHNLGGYLNGIINNNNNTMGNNNNNNNTIHPLMNTNDVNFIPTSPFHFK